MVLTSSSSITNTAPLLHRRDRVTGKRMKQSLRAVGFLRGTGIGFVPAFCQCRADATILRTHCVHLSIFVAVDRSRLVASSMAVIILPATVLENSVPQFGTLARISGLNLQAAMPMHASRRKSLSELGKITLSQAIALARPAESRIGADHRQSVNVNQLNDSLKLRPLCLPDRQGQRSRRGTTGSLEPQRPARDLIFSETPVVLGCRFRLPPGTVVFRDLTNARRKDSSFVPMVRYRATPRGSAFCVEANPVTGKSRLPQEIAQSKEVGHRWASPYRNSKGLKRELADLVAGRPKIAKCRRCWPRARTRI